MRVHIFHCPQPGSKLLISNLLHKLGEHPNLPSRSEEGLAFLFPGGRVAQTTTRKYKRFHVADSLHLSHSMVVQLDVFSDHAASLK